MARIHCADDVSLSHSTFHFPFQRSHNLIYFTFHVCSVPIPQVQPKHVKEAFRLLNKSIIRVETPDINFDEEEELINGWLAMKGPTVSTINSI